MKQQITGAEEVFSARQRLHLFVALLCMAYLAPCCSMLHQKRFDRSVLFRYFSLWNDSFGLAYLTFNEVSAKPMYFLASFSLRRKSFEKG